MKIGLLTLAIVVLGCSPEKVQAPEPEPVDRAAFAAIWCEFLTPAEVESALPLLAARGLAVNLAWPASALADAERVALVRRAEAAGVEIRPWLLLREADGYWPGSGNAELFAKGARELMDLWEQQSLGPTTLIVDMEMDRGRVDQLDALWSKHDVLGAVQLLKSGVDPQRYRAATETYAALVTAAKSRGWRVHLTTLPQVLDDYADGDDGLRQAFGIPVEDIAWDTVTFQAYRTLFGEMLGGDTPPTEYFVYSYGKDARRLFGQVAGLDVGLVGAGVTPSPTYADGAELTADLAAAAAAGVPRDALDVYNLDGVLSRAPVEQWLEAPASGPPPAEDPATVEIRKTVATLDGVL